MWLCSMFCLTEATLILVGTFLLMFPENMYVTAELENSSGGFHGGSNAVSFYQTTVAHIELLGVC